jgi:hypothetical protein
MRRAHGPQRNPATILVLSNTFYTPQGTYCWIGISRRVANHVHIIELEHIDQHPTNNNHPTDGFERIMDVIAFYDGIQNKLRAQQSRDQLHATAHW